jgi:hypothetical protein
MKRSCQSKTAATGALRKDYKSDCGIAAWWQKDGAWHIALPATNRFGEPDMLWTPDQYNTREEAIDAIEFPWEQSQ